MKALCFFVRSNYGYVCRDKSVYSIGCFHLVKKSHQLSKHLRFLLKLDRKVIVTSILGRAGCPSQQYEKKVLGELRPPPSCSFPPTYCDLYYNITYIGSNNARLHNIMVSFICNSKYKDHFPDLWNIWNKEIWACFIYRGFSSNFAKTLMSSFQSSFIIRLHLQNPQAANTWEAVYIPKYCQSKRDSHHWVQGSEWNCSVLSMKGIVTHVLWTTATKKKKKKGKYEKFRKWMEFVDM